MKSEAEAKQKKTEAEAEAEEAEAEAEAEGRKQSAKWKTQLKNERSKNSHVKRQLNRGCDFSHPP